MPTKWSIWYKRVSSILVTETCLKCLASARAEPREDPWPVHADELYHAFTEGCESRRSSPGCMHPPLGGKYAAAVAAACRCDRCGEGINKGQRQCAWCGNCPACGADWLMELQDLESRYPDGVAEADGVSS
jgi:hypothetical protein